MPVMKLPARILSLIGLVALSACGVSPKVRVERAPGNYSGQASATTRSTAPAAAGQRHVVVRGDTLYSIAFRNGLDVRDLIGWNQIAPPYTIFPGQPLRLSDPSQRVVAAPPVTTIKPQPAPTSAASSLPPASTVAIKPTAGTQPITEDASLPMAQPFAEDTVVSVSAQSRPTAPVRPAAGQPGSLIAAIGAAPQPSVSTTATPTPGFKPATTLIKPVDRTVGSAAASTPNAANPLPQTPSSTLPPASATSAPMPIAAVPVVTAPTVAAPVIVDVSGAVATRQGITWRWPTAGTLIRRFVAGDPTQQGIDISGQLGQPVLAVADGDVVYSGNGLLGYGEMIIVQHSPDYLSAYGHNQRRLVTEGSKVKGGQRIAEMGQRGSTVMLHFEIRQRGKPIDPLTYLPAR